MYFKTMILRNLHKEDLDNKLKIPIQTFIFEGLSYM